MAEVSQRKHINKVKGSSGGLMKIQKMIFALFPLLAAFLSACTVSCGEDNSSGEIKSASLRVTNWNVETFFDSVNDGSEYSEFVNCKNWGTDSYCVRLERLCSVIKALDSDVFVMEEVENEGVLQDIGNFLAGEWNSRKIYAYAGFQKKSGSSIGCGILSRYPIREFSVHGLDVRTEGENMPGMRDLICLTVEKDGKELFCW